MKMNNRIKADYKCNKYKILLINHFNRIIHNLKTYTINTYFHKKMNNYKEISIN